MQISYLVRVYVSFSFLSACLLLVLVFYVLSVFALFFVFVL